MVSIWIVFYVIFTILQPCHTLTANDVVPDFNGDFGFGMNNGYHGDNWNDETLSNIALGNMGTGIDQKGVGCNTLRLKLHEEFLDDWGYQIRVDAFEHYVSLGAHHNTVFLEDPAPENFDTTVYCSSSGAHSRLWSSMYEPIFDDGGDTPINENNLLAMYIYQVVSEYSPIGGRFWEIINEPDFTYTSHGWESSGTAGSWWDENPDPCDLTNLICPIFNYIRALRVSYEVIKSIDPSQYVCVGGIGYPSFLDAILRNTDNPLDVSLQPGGEYPLYGGAYFDCLSYHNYPMYSTSEYNYDIPGWEPFRHSDKCVEAFFEAKGDFQNVLDSYGYDGSTFPIKRFIVTETNVPSVSRDDRIGSPEAQRNYIMKVIIKSPSQNMDQVHFFLLCDYAGYDSYAFMGFYENLDYVTPYNQVKLISGIGSKTAANMTLGKTYDPVRTSLLNIPPDSDDFEGFAYYDSQDRYIYALWSKTNTDMSEERELQFSFPESTFSSDRFRSYKIYRWDWSDTNIVTSVTVDSYPITVDLSAVPIFISFDDDIYIDDDDDDNDDDEYNFLDGNKTGEKTHPYDPAAAAIAIIFSLLFIAGCCCCCFYVLFFCLIFCICCSSMILLGGGGGSGGYFYYQKKGKQPMNKKKTEEGGGNKFRKMKDLEDVISNDDDLGDSNNNKFQRFVPPPKRRMAPPPRLPPPRRNVPPNPNMH